MLFEIIVLRQFSICLEILKCPAIPFPEPIGIIPKEIEEPTNRPPTSLIVPSPPQAIIEFTFSRIPFFVSLSACPLYLV